MTPKSISKPYPTTPTPSSPSAPVYMTSAPAWAATTSNVTAARQTSNFHQMCVHSGMAVPCEFSVQCCPATHTGCVWSVAHCRTAGGKKNPQKAKQSLQPFFPVSTTAMHFFLASQPNPSTACNMWNSAVTVLITPKKSTRILAQLHWLPVYHRVPFKVFLLTYKALYGQCPSYKRPHDHPETHVPSAAAVPLYSWPERSTFFPVLYISSAFLCKCLEICPHRWEALYKSILLATSNNAGQYKKSISCTYINLVTIE